MKMTNKNARGARVSARGITQQYYLSAGTGCRHDSRTPGRDRFTPIHPGHEAAGRPALESTP